MCISALPLFHFSHLNAPSIPIITMAKVILSSLEEEEEEERYRDMANPFRRGLGIRTARAYFNPAIPTPLRNVALPTISNQEDEDDDDDAEEEEEEEEDPINSSDLARRSATTRRNLEVCPNATTQLEEVELNTSQFA